MPHLPSMTDSDFLTFAKAIADNFGYNPAYTLAFLSQWAAGENTEARYNPLATTQKMPGSTRFNSVGVQEYATLKDGIRATLDTLDPTRYGGIDYYPAIRRALEFQSIDVADRALVASELRTWGTTPFASQIANGWNPDVSVPVTPDVSLNDAVLRRFAALARAAEVYASAVRDAANPDTIPPAAQ